VAPRKPELAERAGQLCRRVGYSGVADLDWRYDRRDGRYNLVNFNPRSAQFRLFENVHGVDVVRAMHLDLTGRDVPDVPQAERRVFVAGQLDVPSVMAWLREEHRLPSDLLYVRPTERVWIRRDDPLAGLGEAVRFSGLVMRRMAGSARARVVH
jgi:hypothetical protein